MSRGEAAVVVDGVDFAEAPRWHEGRLWYSDFYQRAVYAIAADGTREAIVEVPGQPSGLGWLPDGSLLVVSMTDRTVRRFDGTTLSLHADLSHVAAHHCNDMVVDRRGNAYVGNFGYDFHAEGPAGVRPARLALVRPHGTVEVAADDLWFPNGTVITPDGRMLIVAESAKARLTAFDIAVDGTLSRRLTWADVPGYAPDGCTLDDAGGVWFADGLGRRVVRVLQGGTITEVIDFDDRTFACMLGGVDGRTLYVCTAPDSDPAVVAGAGSAAIQHVRVTHPHAGLP